MDTSTLAIVIAYINKVREKISQKGVTDIDLSAYALKADSLAGYGIEDAYTKTEIDTVIGDVNTALQQLVTEFSGV